MDKQKMEYQCWSDGHGSRALRDGASVYLEGGLSGLARELRELADQPSNSIGARRTRAIEGSQVISKWKRTEKLKGHDSLMAFAEIERLTSKVYFRFSHLFLHHPMLRDFWWEMAMEKERRACNLTVMSAVVKNDPDADDPGLSREKTDQLRERLTSYLRKGTPTIAPEEAFRIALEIEASEMDMMCSEPLKPEVAGIAEARGGDRPRNGWNGL